MSPALDSLGAMADPTPAPSRPVLSRGDLRVEILIVLGVSLGASALYAIVRLADILTRGPIREAQANLNASASRREFIDLAFQLLDVGLALVPVALALYLMNRDRLGGQGPALQRIGLDGRRPVPDLAWGVGLFLLMGSGTLLAYWAGRTLGLTAAIRTDNLGDYWWTVPILILAAVKNGVLEQVIVVGYLFDRLRRLGYSPLVIVIATALLRGSYHLYQGVGPFVGNVAMGLVFGVVYLRYGRIAPLVVAHSLLDITGYLAPGVLTRFE